MRKTWHTIIHERFASRRVGSEKGRRRKRVHVSVPPVVVDISRQQLCPHTKLCSAVANMEQLQGDGRGANSRGEPSAHTYAVLTTEPASVKPRHPFSTPFPPNTDEASECLGKTLFSLSLSLTHTHTHARAHISAKGGHRLLIGQPVGADDAYKVNTNK